MMGLEVVHHVYTPQHVNQLLDHHKKVGFTALIRLRVSRARDVTQTEKLRCMKSLRQT